MKEIERTLSFMKNDIATIYGIEILEYYDKNYLNGDNATRGKNKIEILNSILKQIDNLSKQLNLI